MARQVAATSRFDAARQSLDRIHHVVLLALAAVVAIARYGFATLALGGLPWAMD